MTTTHTLQSLTSDTLCLSYRQLQALVKQQQVGRTDKPVALNKAFNVLAARYTELTGVPVVKALSRTEQRKVEAAKAVVDGKPTYKELQAYLKNSGDCKVKRNSKYEVLLAEYNRISLGV